MLHKIFLLSPVLLWHTSLIGGLRVISSSHPWRWFMSVLLMHYEQFMLELKPIHIFLPKSGFAGLMDLILWKIVFSHQNEWFDVFTPKWVIWWSSEIHHDHVKIEVALNFWSYFLTNFDVTPLKLNFRTFFTRLWWVSVTRMLVMASKWPK